MAAKPTSRDVARALGIAQSTVSRAFTPGASISDVLRARIRAMADELGYRPNLLARGLIAGRSNLVGVVIAPQTNLLYPELLFELGERLAAADHQLLLFPAADEAAAARAVERLQAYRVDAVLATGVLGEADARALAGAGVPLVTFNRLVAGVAGVSCDFAGGAAALARELLADGRRRLALIGGPRDSWVGADFEAGVRAACAEPADVVLAVEPAPYAYEQGLPALRRAERRLGGPADGVLCVNDTVAAGCYDGLAAGSGGEPLPPVRTICRPGALREHGRDLGATRQPVEQMIAIAVDMLLHGCHDREHRRLPPIVSAPARSVTDPG